MNPALMLLLLSSLRHPPRRQAGRSIDRTAPMIAGAGHARRPVILEPRSDLGSVLNPVAGVPHHHSCRAQRLPVTLLIGDPDRAFFQHHDDWRGGTESLH